MRVIITCRSFSKKDESIYHTTDIIELKHKVKTEKDFDELINKVAELHSNLEFEKNNIIVLFMKYIKK